MSDKNLESYFNFNAGDLDANRAGKLTKRQIENLSKEEKGTRIVSTVLALASAVLTVIPIVKVASGAAGSPISWVGYLAWIIPAGFFTFIFTRRAMERIHDGKVKTVKGTARIRAERVSPSSSDQKLDYELRIGDEIFDVDSEVVEYMQQGEVYAVYYLADPHTNSPQEILSVEHFAKKK